MLDVGIVALGVVLLVVWPTTVLLAWRAERRRRPVRAGEVECDRCDGTGADPRAAGVAVCPTCRGTGTI